VADSLELSAVGSSVGSQRLDRLRHFARTGRPVVGLLAGALLGLLVRELGFWNLLGWDQISMQGMLLFAVAGAAGSLWPRVVRFLWAADLALLCLLCVVAFTSVTSALAGRWIRADPKPEGGVDAVVVLSADLTASGTLSAISSDRLLTALDLVKRGAAPRVVTTRVTDNSAGYFFSSDADQLRLVTLAGLTDRWIRITDDVHSTRDEAVAVARRLRLLGVRRIGVVTSPMHTRRACATFEQVGLSVVCVPALERGEQTLRSVSERDRLAAFRYYLYERLAWLEYRRRGWVAAAERR
jgi:uncharacterized SAM-binding protein YcdF (DUF218 family)